LGAIDISLLTLGAFYGILIIPILLSLLLKLKLIKTILIAVFRMTLQLFLVGLYLDVIFQLNKWWINGLWLLAMLLTASGNVIKSAGLRFRFFFPAVIAGILLGIFTSGAVLLYAIHPDPLYDAQHLIPIMGMLLGNSMRGNILALERFYHSLLDREKDYVTTLMLGATKGEALTPFLQEAIKPALMPTLSTMTTLGIVSLPGMMTGQILGGSSPNTAIKYQIAIMIAIFTAVSISALISIGISRRKAFNDYHILQRNIFKS